MMRSLYTAATGMIAQQTNLDTISNNLSNVNTTGYKTERTEFKSLLYQTLQTKTTTANGANKPVGAQVGLGTRVAATMSNYTQGAREETEIPTDFALEGKGFFAVRGVDGHITPETVTSPGVRIRMETQFWQPQRGFRYWIPEEIPFVCREAYLRKAWYFRAMERLAIKMQPAM